MQWLNQNAGAVQAVMAIIIGILTAVLIGVTWWYARLTRRMALTLEQQLAASFHPDIEMTLIHRFQGQSTSAGVKSEGVCWCNPPYGLALRQWLRNAHESAGQGATVVCLVPARTDTQWWHDYVLPHAEIRYLRGRLKFNGIGNSATFPSAIAVFRPACG